jgi:Amt family ammonium transporter
MTWLVIERFMVGKSTAIGFATGAVAGLATVTPAAGFISPGAALIFGLVAACICYPMIKVVKSKLEIDDSLDVFAVHGMGGMAGSLLLAVFMAPALGGTGDAESYSIAGQLGGQAVGVFVVAIWSALASALLALGISWLMPMRVSDDTEREGLDIASHGERGWEFD